MEVKVNGQLIELGGSMPAITKKSIDVQNPTARFLDITNSFVLPYNNINGEIFEHPAQVGGDGRGLDKSYDVTIFDLFEMFRGKGYLTKVTKDSIHLQCTDNSKELFNALTANINSIPFDNEDTELTQTAIDALDTYDETTCWFWGKLCLHEDALTINSDETTGDNRALYSRPSFNLQAFLKAAIEAEGYTYTGSNLQLAFSGWHNDFFFTSYQKTLSSTYNPAGTVALSGLDTNDFEHADITANSTDIEIGSAKTMFRVRGSITSDAIVEMIIRATDDVDGTKTTESVLIIGIGTNDYDFTTSEFQSDNDITIDIRLVGTGEVIFNDVLLYTIHSDKDFDLSTNPFLDYRIKAYDNLPELTYLDLFKIVSTLANEYHIVDTYNKAFSFGSLANLNKLNAVDWSDKFIIGTETIEDTFKGLAQKNWLKYDNDITVFKELGWSYFTTDNEKLEAEKDYITMNFGASNDANDKGHVKIYNDTTRIVDQEIMPRIFSVDGSSLVFEPLKWSNLKANYYENWFNTLYRIRAVNAQFNLSKLDVLKWTEKQLVYIDYFKTTFIVLEISNFIPGRKTTCKLLAYGR